MEIDRDYESRITVNPDVCGGKPCISGTRVMVSNLLGMLAGGYDRDRILGTYPQLTAQDISEALRYAAQMLDQLAPSGPDKPEVNA